MGIIFLSFRFNQHQKNVESFLHKKVNLTNYDESKSKSNFSETRIEKIKNNIISLYTTKTHVQ